MWNYKVEDIFGIIGKSDNYVITTYKYSFTKFHKLKIERIIKKNFWSIDFKIWSNVYKKSVEI